MDNLRGGGYAINPAPEQRNYYFGGWLLQRDFGERLTLGGEIFAQGKSNEGIRSFAVFNLGGFFKITPNFQFSLPAATPSRAVTIPSVIWAFIGPGDSAKKPKFTRDYNL